MNILPHYTTFPSADIQISHDSLQGSFPAGMPGNTVPKVILTVGTAFLSQERNNPVVIYTFCAHVAS